VDTEILVDKVDREACFAGSEPNTWNCAVQIVKQVVKEIEDFLIDRDDCHGFQPLAAHNGRQGRNATPAT